MITFKSKLLKNFLAAILLFSLIGIIGFAGCSPTKIIEEGQVSPDEQDKVQVEEESPEGDAIEAEEDTTQNADLSKREITGNINILSGLEISDTVNNSRPIAVMVQNNPVARPQSGLHLADIIVEIVDEGGVTRYIAIYSSYDAELIWSIRSTRPYYSEFARSFDPIYAFWGT